MNEKSNSTSASPHLHLLPIRTQLMNIFNNYSDGIKKIIIQINSQLNAPNPNYNAIQKEIRKVLDLDPSNIYAKNLLGIIFAFYKKYREAEKLFSEIILINNKMSIGWNNKAMSLYYQGRYYDALESINKARRYRY